MPILGNHPRKSEKIRIRINARKKDGVDTDISDTTIRKLSENLFWRRAEIIPISMPIIPATMVPPTARIME